MSKRADNRTNIMTHFETAKVGTAVALTGLTTDNHKYNPVEGSPFIRVTIKDGAGQKVGFGTTGRYRHTGVVITQIFVPDDTGTTAALQMADAVDLIWRGASFNGIHFQTPDVTIVGNVQGWFQVNVVAPYYWDDIV